MQSVPLKALLKDLYFSYYAHKLVQSCKGLNEPFRIHQMPLLFKAEGIN